MLRRIYDRILLLAASPRAALWLFAVAFAESSFFPIPPDPLLGAMALARPRRALRYALVCTTGSVLGGLLGYYIGYALFEEIARPLLRLYHYEDSYAAFEAKFTQYGLYIILAKGLLPIPFKIITIASGAARFDLPTFIAACILTRGLRFLAEAVLLRYLGNDVRKFIEKRLTTVAIVSVVAAVLGVVMLKYI